MMKVKVLDFVLCISYIKPKHVNREALFFKVCVPVHNRHRRCLVIFAKMEAQRVDWREGCEPCDLRKLGQQLLWRISHKHDHVELTTLGDEVRRTVEDVDPGFRRVQPQNGRLTRVPMAENIRNATVESLIITRFVLKLVTIEEPVRIITVFHLLVEPQRRCFSLGNPVKRVGLGEVKRHGYCLLVVNVSVVFVLLFMPTISVLTRFYEILRLLFHIESTRTQCLHTFALVFDHLDHLEWMVIDVVVDGVVLGLGQVQFEPVVFLLHSGLYLFQAFFR